MISKEAKREYDIKYRKEHYEHLKALKSVWRSKNKEKLCTWVKKWRASENGRKSIKKWRDKSPRYLRDLYKSSAKRRNLTFEISLELFENIISQDCIYCGQQANIKRNGLDRIDNTKGYEIDNVVPCCFRCNQMKGKLSVEEFFYHIGRILEHGVE